MPIDPSSLSPPIRKMIAGVTVLGIVCALATVRYVAAGWSVADAFYMVVINIPQLAARWSPVTSSKAFTSRGVTMRDE